MRVRPLIKALSATIAGLCLSSAVAAAEFDDPEWPCIQRKVPQLALAQMWPGAPPEGDWRERPEIAQLAPVLAPRRTPLEEVEAQGSSFAESLPPEERAEQLAELFAGVLSFIDKERGQLIAGIGRYARNQAALAEHIDTLETELAELEAAPEKDLERIKELEETLHWETRIFTERAQALTYVCETPVLLEQRAFAIARLLASHI